MTHDPSSQAPKTQEKSQRESQLQTSDFVSAHPPLPTRCTSQRPAKPPRPSISTLAPRSPLSVVILRPQTNPGPLRRRPQIPRPRLVERQPLGDGGEEVVDVFGRLCRGFEEEQSRLGGVLSRIVGGDGALGGLVGDEVELVAREGDDDVLVGLALQLLDPGFGFVEGGLCWRLVHRGWARWGQQRTACVMS